jgi:hypothetical protein
MRTTVEDSGRAWIDLVDDPGEIREMVELAELETADRVPALDALAGIEVTDSAGSVLPPALIDEEAA